MSGIFGVVSKGNCVETLYYGTDYHSHLGTEFGGIAVLGDGFSRHIRDISQSQFKSKLFEDYQSMHGNKGIGVISDLDEQPIYLNSKFGPFSIVTNGIVENTKELADQLLQNGISFSEVSKRVVNVTELIAKLMKPRNVSSLLCSLFDCLFILAKTIENCLMSISGHWVVFSGL